MSTSISRDVAREADPEDRRSTFAALTPEGLRAFRRARPVYLAAMAQHFSAALTPTQRRAIAAGLTHVLGALDDPGVRR